MKQRIAMILIAVLFLINYMPTDAYAHTVLEKSAPMDGDVLSLPVEEVTATFSQEIQAFSKLTVLDASGKAVEPEQTTVDAKVLRATFNPALPNGNYTVEWQAVAGDGHAVQGSFAFAVNILESEPTPPDAPARVDTNEPTDTPTLENKPNEPASEQAADSSLNKEANSLKPYVTAAAVLLVAILAALSVLLFRKRPNGE